MDIIRNEHITPAVTTTSEHQQANNDRRLVMPNLYDLRWAEVCVLDNLAVYEGEPGPPQRRVIEIGWGFYPKGTYSDPLAIVADRPSIWLSYGGQALSRKVIPIKPDKAWTLAVFPPCFAKATHEIHVSGPFTKHEHKMLAFDLIAAYMRQQYADTLRDLMACFPSDFPLWEDSSV